jgi:hypothetical protein
MNALSGRINTPIAEDEVNAVYKSIAKWWSAFEEVALVHPQHLISKGKHHRLRVDGERSVLYSWSRNHGGGW